MNIEQKILDYKSQLDYFDDVMDKYKLLLDQGKKASVFPEEYKQKSFLVKGCQANVWLVPKFDKGLMFFLSDIYGNETPKTILNSDFEKLKTLGLDNILTPSRRNGVYSMLEYIKKYSKDFMN